MSTTTEPNTHEMVIVHRVFRREFHLLPDLISRVAERNTERAALLAEHLTDMVASLHHHHEGEDDLLWPPLLKQATLHTDLVHRMEASTRICRQRWTRSTSWRPPGQLPRARPIVTSWSRRSGRPR